MNEHTGGQPCTTTTCPCFAAGRREGSEEHGKHVEQFLNDLYAIMVDPCAEGTIKVDEMKVALLEAAKRDREFANNHQITAAQAEWAFHEASKEAGQFSEPWFVEFARNINNLKSAK